MPILIAHRGNMEGPSPEYENQPNYILGGLSIYPHLHCEVDVWWVDGEFFLGHDAPQYPVKESFLVNARLWCHAKNMDSLERMLGNPLIHCFWHQNDDAVLTTRGYVWTYPGKSLIRNSISVLPEKGLGPGQDNAVGICSDFIINYF